MRGQAAKAPNLRRQNVLGPLTDRDVPWFPTYLPPHAQRKTPSHYPWLVYQAATEWFDRAKCESSRD